MKAWSYHSGWALVTGASSGLGEEFARQLSARGMNLVISARRSERLELLSAELRARDGIEVVVEPADLAVAGEPLRLWRDAGRGRTVNLLVNNAGFGAHGRFDTIDAGRQVGMVRVNCIALLELAHAAVAEMRTSGSGALINVASLAGFQPVPNMATYAATKAFVLSLSESLWAENRQDGVRVVALCPGRTPTEFQAVAGSGDPRKSFGVREPKEVVAAALHALEEGSMIVVPGIENRLAALAGRLAPRSLLTRVVGPIIRRRAGR